MKPYEDITFAIVVWNDAERLKPLLEYVRPYFERLAVVVQESSDRSLDVAIENADIVVKDRHHGYGDASFGPKLLPQIPTTWTFKIDADEWPTEELLVHLGTYVKEADEKGTKGVWIPFRSWTEGREYEEQHAHLRLFHTKVGWPGMLHSRPPIEDGFVGDVGSIEHRRSLDEMMRDYVEYYRIGINNPGWVAHNRLMMKSACDGVAAVKGWKYVRSFDWWPSVLRAAYDGKEPFRMKVYCTGSMRSGTRLLFDIVNAMGHEGVHAVMPGYHDLPTGGPDLDNPVWWTPKQMTDMFGEGVWIEMRRDRKFAGASAIRVGKAKDKDDYDKMAKRADKAIDKIGDRLVIDYESLVGDPGASIEEIREYLGGGKDVPTDGIVDGNEKYLVDEEPEEESVQEVDTPDAISADVTTVTTEVEEKEA